MPRQACFGKAACIGTIHAIVAVVLTQGEGSKREEDQASSPPCPYDRQSQGMLVGPCRERGSHQIALYSRGRRGRVERARPVRGNKKLKTKAKFTLSLLVDAFQIFAVVYPLTLVSVCIVRALMRWNLG